MLGAPAIHKTRPMDRISPRAPAMGLPFSRDRLHMVNRDAAAHAAFAMMDKVQHETPELALVAISLLFTALCHRFMIDPHDMHTQATAMLRHEPGHRAANAHIEALDDLAKEQWQHKQL
jgi:hypothetical protein